MVKLSYGEQPKMTPAELLADKQELTRLLNLIRRTHDLGLNSGKVFTGRTLKAFSDLHDAISTWNF